MKHAAHIQATIELLNLNNGGNKPADRLISAYFKERRYIGGSDKKNISELFYIILRTQGAPLARLQQLGMTPSGRALMIAHLLTENKDLSDIFTGETYHPAPLSQAEQEMVEVWEEIILVPLPQHAQLNMPAWVLPKLEETFGREKLAEACHALNQQAPLDLRTNVLKLAREQLNKKLKLEKPEFTKLSPWGLRLANRTPIHTSPYFKDGFFEVQDEGSQLIAWLTEAKPGQMVVDFCAGAGGKTLAIAALMENKGRLFACDIEEYKLEETKKRLRRAGVNNTQTRLLDSDGNRWCKRQAGQADVVLVDAPCSGSGTWRRSPDGKWKLTQERLNELTQMQSQILEKSAKMVKIGGRLIYATCSVFPEENESQVESFMNKTAGFKLVDASSILPETVVETHPPFMALAPHIHGTDGFFAAVFERELNSPSPLHFLPA